MVRLADSIVDDIVRSCLESYTKLPKTGKPVENEWTVLSCVVQYDTENGKHEVVSVGSGSKCVGAGVTCSEAGASGAVLLDSHAEVCARRALLLHLYRHIQAASEHRHSIFTLRNKNFIHIDNIELIFYSSQLPCGDASIMHKNEGNDNIGAMLKPSKRPAVDEICDIASKFIRTEDDIHRTGAKCLPSAEQDPKAYGSGYHLLGKVRTKPGRGDRTLSVSCSDKIARWVHVGIQGALLHLLCGPIYIKHFIFGGGVPYSEESLRRALLIRESGVITTIVPEFYQSSIVFSHIKTDLTIRPAPGSIIWCKGNLSEVAVQGRRLGVTKKTAVSPKNYLIISKYKLYEKFISIMQNNRDLREHIGIASNIETVPYKEMKKKSVKYMTYWGEVKKEFFKMWTEKPDNMWSFCIEQKITFNNTSVS